MRKMMGLALGALCLAFGAEASEPSMAVDRQMLVDFLSLPSRSHDLVQLNRGIDFLKDWLTRRGVFCTVETNECGYTGLYAATTPGKVHDYMFVGHVDVVAAPDEMFRPRIEGDRIFARGACDTKGNVLVMCQVLANLVGKASVGMFIATDEENGGSGTQTPQMMIDRGYMPRKLILVGDTAGEKPNQLFIAEKGHAHIDLVAHGKGGHSSRPWALDNPIPKLCEGYLKFKEAWDRGADPNKHWRTVLSPTVLHASDVGNVVADEATMHFSCRYTSDSELERAVKTMKETTGLEVRVAEHRRPPVVNRPGDPEVVALWWEMNDRIRGGMDQGRMSAATDASFFVGKGVPIVIWTAVGGEPHSAREWGSLKSLDEYVALFTRYFEENEAAGVNEIAYHRLAGTPKPFYYAARQPLEKGSACEVAVVQVHGWGDGVWTPLEMISIMKALKRATPEGQEVPYVVDPFFPRQQVLAERNLPDDGRAIWNDSWTESCVTMGSADDDWRGGGDAVGTTFSSFDAIDMIFAKLGDRKLYPNLRRVVLTGFSAGGQFVGRYVAVGKGKVRDGVTLEYAAMSPSTEFRFERDDPWLYGLKGRPRYSAKLTEEQILANLSSRHVRRACGTLDNQVGSQYAVDGTPPALAQGRSRYERFVNFEKYLKGYPDWARQVTFHPLEGLGHDSPVAQRLPDFIDYVLGKGDK